MRNRGSVFRYVVVCLLCCGIIGYSIYGYIFQDIVAVKKNSVISIKGEDFAFSEDITDISQIDSVSKAESTSNAASSKSEGGTVTAAAQGTVKGKVISQYIQPYNASLSYNNVFVKNSTNLKIDIKDYLDAKLGFDIKKGSEPEVLIMHTHTTESYLKEDLDYYTDDYTSRSRDQDKNMVRVGEIVAKKLNDGGINTIHDKTEHDYPKYTGSYSNAAKTITSYTKKYPSIKIVLDLHRDAIASGESDKVKLVTEIAGKKAAQVMIVMGSQSGSVTNFPDWGENFKLAVKLQQTLEVKFPTLARPLSLMSKNYNESLTTGSLLIEFGTDANTIDEACYSAEMVGDSLVSLLNTLH